MIYICEKCKCLCGLEILKNKTIICNYNICNKNLIYYKKKEEFSEKIYFIRLLREEKDFLEYWIDQKNEEKENYKLGIYGKNLNDLWIYDNEIIDLKTQIVTINFKKFIFNLEGEFNIDETLIKKIPIKYDFNN